MMMMSRHTAILRMIPFLIAICRLALPAQAKYSGGTGELNDPYRIAEDMESSRSCRQRAHCSVQEQRV